MTHTPEETTIFAVSGYNYQVPPRFYKNDLPIQHTQSHRDSDNLVYVHTYLSPQSELCDSDWIVVTNDRTSEGVMPNVTELIRQHNMTVSKLYDQGYNHYWKLSC